MASVSELNTAVSTSMGVDYTVASQYSRQLINAGLLPKSSGRAVADVEPRHVLRLMIAIGLGCKYHEAAASVSKYLDLMHDGVPDTAPESIKETVEDRLLYSFMMVIAPIELTPPTLEGHRRAERNLRYEFFVTWPQVTIHEDGSIVEVFKEIGKLPGHLQGTFYRSFTLSCWSFDEFDDWDFGLDGDFWKKFFAKDELASSDQSEAESK